MKTFPNLRLGLAGPGCRAGKPRKNHTYGPLMSRQGRRQKRKHHVLESVVFSWFAHTGLYGIHVGAREEAKTKNPLFRKCGFFVDCPYGFLCHPCGRQGRRKKRKNHVLESVFFSWFAHTGLYVIHVGGRQGRRQKRKNHVLESVVFSWFAHTGSYVTPVGGKEGGKNEKTTLCKTWFFRGLPIRALSPLWEARKEEKNEKTTLYKMCFFFVICLYGIHVGAREEAKTKKPRFRKCGFFRGLPIRALMSPLWEARKEEKTKKTHFVKRVFFFVVCPYGLLCHPCGRQGRRKNRKKHTL